MTIDMFAATNKACLDLMLGATAGALKTFEQLSVLQLRIVKARLAEGANFSRAALAVTDSASLLALQQRLALPDAQSAVSYGGQLFDIVSCAHADACRLAENSAAQLARSFVPAAQPAPSRPATLGTPASAASAAAVSTPPAADRNAARDLPWRAGARSVGASNGASNGATDRA